MSGDLGIRRTTLAFVMQQDATTRLKYGFRLDYDETITRALDVFEKIDRDAR